MKHVSMSEKQKEKGNKGGKSFFHNIVLFQKLQHLQNIFKTVKIFNHTDKRNKQLFKYKWKSKWFVYR